MKVLQDGGATKWFLVSCWEKYGCSFIQWHSIENHYTVSILLAIFIGMGKWIVYVTASLDGYIARRKGWLNRLKEVQECNELDYSYDGFIDSIDTILLGKNTYTQILKSHTEWPYKDFTTYVMSRDPDLEITTPNTHGINGLSPETVEKLHVKSKKNIWILWWWVVISQCLDLGVVDEMVISMVPILLWKWTPLFTGMNKEIWLTLVKTELLDSGTIMLHYKKQEAVVE